MPSPAATRRLVDEEFLLMSRDRVPGGDYQRRIDLVESFHQRPVLAATLDPATVNQAALRLYTGATKDWQLSGTNAANAGSALNVDGGCALATAGADNDQMLLAPATAINSVAQSSFQLVEWEPEHAPMFECQLQLPAITALAVQAGWVLTAALDLTTDADQAKFQFSTEGATSTANWTAATSIGGTDVEADTGVAVAADTTYRLRVDVGDDRVPIFYVNDSKVYTGSALTAGVNFIPFIGIQALAAAAKTVKVRTIRCSRLL